MSKERLEEIKKRTLISTSTFGDIEVIHIEYHDYDWLIEQAERVQELKRFSISKDELKEVLNSNENIGELYQFVEDEHSIRDVFAIIVKEMGYLAGALGEYSESYFDLEQQNKRYREAREIIEQVYKENYVRNANTYGYEDGYLDGLDTAIGIIDKALEDEE